MIGTRVAHYEITTHLGSGGMGDVYQAADTKLDRSVAIKFLPEAFSNDSERVALFRREARVLASLNHPNIAAIYGVEETGGRHFLVMELVLGETLEERIARGAIPIDEALHISKQIAEALEAAHEQGIIHRDLKPANIKVRPDGSVKVLDFGLAKAAPESIHNDNSPTATGLTQAGVIIGTPAYMSPEQAKGKAVDKRSDIWAFGVVLYEMLTGQRLFQGETFSETLAAVLRHEVDWRPIPTKIERLLRRCLERDPKLRLRDIGDYRLLLEDAPRDAAAFKSRLGLVGWAVAAVSLAALALAVFLPRTEKPHDRPLMRLSVDLGPDYAPNVTGPWSTVLSPDGTKLVYRARATDGKIFLALRSLGLDTATLLRGTENPDAPFFSPDGQSIGFVADRKLKKIALQGGTPMDLASIVGGTLGASWGDDGTIVAPFNPTSGLFRLHDDGRKPEPLTMLANGEVTHRFPQILPGSNAVIFTAASSMIGDYDNATIQVVSLKTGKAKTLITGGFAGRYVPSNGKRGHLIYIHQGGLVAVPFDPVTLELRGKTVTAVDEVAAASSNVNGVTRFTVSGADSASGTFVYQDFSPPPKWQVLWLDSSGKTQPLVTMPNYYTTLRSSPDGQRLAVTVNNYVKGNDLYVYDIPRDTMTQLTFNGQENLNPVWTPDGRHLVFTSRSGVSWIRADGGSEPQLLLPANNLPTPYSFSPDGKSLAYSARNLGSPDANSDIWILPLDLSDPEHPKPQKPEAFLNSPRPEVQPAFSPDGRWIAYVEAPESGNRELWVRPFPGPGGMWKISSGGGTTPIWSRTQLFFRGMGGEIMVVDYTSQGDSFTAFKPRVWSERQVFQPAGADGRGMDLPPDGKRFMIFDRPTVTPLNTRLIFLVNFFDELRRRAPEGN